MQSIETDVLIIGSGGAGLRAAIEAHDAGSKVLVLGKSLLGKAHTVMAEGGINAALGDLDPEDNWKVHARDTLREGRWLGDPRIVEILCKSAPATIRELEQFGMLFDRTEDGKIMQRPFGGHTYRRTCHVEDRSGLELITVLVDQVRKRKIQFLEETFITKLFTKSDRVIGAMGVNIQKGELVVIQSKTIILATGGSGRVYKKTTNPWESRGDGLALAYDAGASLMDMEMIQFHPTGLVEPESAAGILISESVRGEGGILLNAKGERFMEKYDPEKKELAGRDVVAKAIFDEIQSGRGVDNKGVWLDISHKDAAFIHKKIPKMVKIVRDFNGKDLTKDKVLVSPTTHYTMGGVLVDPESHETSIHELYAVGESASGVHGANRLGGNSLIDIVVFGKRAGQAAAARAKKNKHVKIPDADVEKEKRRIHAPFDALGNEKPEKLISNVQQALWDNVSIYRNSNGLKKSLKTIKSLQKNYAEVSIQGSLKFNHSWMNYRSLGNMLIVAEMITRSALKREESRGAHQRADFQKTMKEWHRNLVLKKTAKGMQLTTRAIPKASTELSKFLKENP